MEVDNISDIPIEQLWKHPVVQNLMEQYEPRDLENEVKLPYVIKDKILMSPGVWNGYFYSEESIKDAYVKTEWDRKEVRSLFLDHLDGSNEKMASLTWVGEIKNQRMEGDTLRGDLVVVDKPTAMKLAYGAKMGISPKVSGGEEEGKMVEFRYDNFSVVINPAVKTAYINNSQNEVINEVSESINNKEVKMEVKKDIAKVEPKKGAEAKVENQKEKIVEASKKEVKAEVKVEPKAEEVVEESKVEEPVKEEPKVEEAKEEPKVEEAVKEAKVEPEAKVDEKTIVEKALEIVMAENVKLKADLANKVQVENSEVVSNDKETIKELSEKIETLEKKFNEPDKASVKSEELSQTTEDPDMDFMNMLQSSE